MRLSVSDWAAVGGIAVGIGTALGAAWRGGRWAQRILDKLDELARRVAVLEQESRVGAALESEADIRRRWDRRRRPPARK